MVKDEDDIVEDWILYHGEIFGYNNLFIFDNYSTDNTFSICQKYVKNGIHLFRERDYKKKGIKMTLVMRKVSCDIFFPIDIDEFIVYYDDESITINKDYIVNYIESQFHNLKQEKAFKCHYIIPVCTNEDDSFESFTHGWINKGMGNWRKTYLNKHNIGNYMIDHGNHMYDLTFSCSDICLVHYHSRNHNQMIKKIKNNVQGLHLPLNLSFLKSLIKQNPKHHGNHHIKNMIKILKDDNVSFQPHVVSTSNQPISLHPIIEFLKETKSKRIN
jgi:hypothetical protein